MRLNEQIIQVNWLMKKSRMAQNAGKSNITSTCSLSSLYTISEEEINFRKITQLIRDN